MAQRGNNKGGGKAARLRTMSADVCTMSLPKRPDELGELGEVVIEGDGDLARVCDAAEEFLAQGGAPIFQRGGILVRVVVDGSELKGLKRDPSAPRIVPFDDLSLADVMTRHLKILRRNRKTGDLVRIDCPPKLAATMLSRKQWSFPRLEAVVEHPIMLPSGEVVWESQYHEGTGILLQLPFATFHAPYDQPSREEMAAALDSLLELIGGFAFVDDTDRSVALAFLLTSFVRPLLSTAPAFAMTAPTAGTGKSMLTTMQAKLATGRGPALMTYGEDNVERDKLLFSAMLAGDQHIAIDNVDVPIQGATLAAVLTSPLYRGRILGQSLTAEVPTKAVFSFNGNNLEIRGDLTRRVLVCRMDARCERPAERLFDFNPLEEVDERRADFVFACLTIMSGYIATGERVDVDPFGSFEDWSRLVREPLIYLGLPDPVLSIRTLEAFDPERTMLASMLTAVHGACGAGEFKTAGLIALARTKPQQTQLDASHSLTAAQHEALNEALQAVCERNGELNAKALGRWLLKVVGRIEGGLRFVKSRQTDVGALWRVVTS